MSLVANPSVPAVSFLSAILTLPVWPGEDPASLWLMDETDPAKPTATALTAQASGFARDVAQTARTLMQTANRLAIGSSSPRASSKTTVAADAKNYANRLVLAAVSLYRADLAQSSSPEQIVDNMLYLAILATVMRETARDEINRGILRGQKPIDVLAAVIGRWNTELPNP